MCSSRSDWRLALLLSAPLVLAGCESLSYYGQSVRGHLSLLAGARDIQSLIADARIDGVLREHLRPVPQMLEFARTELDLPDNGSYRRYTDVAREAVVWSLVAAPAFGLEPTQWCYPVIGCATYRGYFERTAAQAKAAELQAQGLDVAVLPVPAYSTLGWFADPLPSTVIDWPDYRLAGLIFHELAHQRLYIAGDSAFNESYASLIEEEGTRRWLQSHGDPAALARWQAEAGREADFIALIDHLRTDLTELYASDIDAAVMAATKRRLFDRLREDYQVLRAAWGGYAGYDAWIARDLNNAHLGSIATYQRRLPALRRLLQANGGDIRAFHRACAELAELTPTLRAQRLDGG